MVSTMLMKTRMWTRAMDHLTNILKKKIKKRVSDFVEELTIIGQDKMNNSHSAPKKETTTSK